jgi:hypothetical protein
MRSRRPRSSGSRRSSCRCRGSSGGRPVPYPTGICVPPLGEDALCHCTSISSAPRRRPSFARHPGLGGNASHDPSVASTVAESGTLGPPSETGAPGATRPSEGPSRTAFGFTPPPCRDASSLYLGFPYETSRHPRASDARAALGSLHRRLTRWRVGATPRVSRHSLGGGSRLAARRRRAI